MNLTPVTRHVPQRTCCGCRGVDAQAALVRLTTDQDDMLVLDAARRRGGRGAYLHPSPVCWEKFLRGRLHVRSLRRSIPVGQRAAVVERLRSMRGQSGNLKPEGTLPERVEG
jgi:predicted RNA-binding protein YlxR (DUF448 family)